MSEIVLFAIDAPHINGTEEAADFVENSANNNVPPTTRIASFFSQLLQVWPENGSAGAVWYEDFTHNQPSGSFLEMSFELREFDENRLEELKNIASQHEIHIFDPEGEVLYLADGSEASA